MWDILVNLHITIEQMGTSPFSLGRSTISAMFNSEVVVYQMVSGDDNYRGYWGEHEIINMAISADWIILNAYGWIWFGDFNIVHVLKIWQKRS